MRGAEMRQMIPGTSPARAQVPQEMGYPRDCVARSTARGLAAMAVMNMAEEIVLVWKQVFITYAPILFWVPSDGLLPHDSQRACSSDMIIKNLAMAQAECSNGSHESCWSGSKPP